MNTLTRIAIGTAASGVVILAGVAPAMAAPASSIAEAAVVSPHAVSAPAAASYNHRGFGPNAGGEYYPVAYAPHTVGLELPIAPIGAARAATTAASHQLGHGDAGHLGFGVPDLAPRHLNDF